MSIEKTKTRLMNKAVHYLGRYSASEHRLRAVLGRFATRKLSNTNQAEVASAIKSVIEKCLRLGYVNNDEFAEALARSQRRQGKSSMLIWQKLRQHALDDTVISDALKLRLRVVRVTKILALSLANRLSNGVRVLTSVVRQIECRVDVLFLKIIQRGVDAVSAAIIAIDFEARRSHVWHVL
mgnify:CR=1 FL=1